MTSPLKNNDNHTSNKSPSKEDLIKIKNNNNTQSNIQVIELKDDYNIVKQDTYNFDKLNVLDVISNNNTGKNLDIELKEMVLNDNIVHNLNNNVENNDNINNNKYSASAANIFNKNKLFDNNSSLENNNNKISDQIARSNNPSRHLNNKNLNIDSKYFNSPTNKSIIDPELEHAYNKVIENKADSLDIDNAKFQAASTILPSQTNLKIDTELNELLNNYNFKGIRVFNSYMLVITAAIGFFFMGYNLAVFNTMVVSMRITFSWDAESIESLTSISSAILPIGCLFGGVTTGYISSKIGRRYTIMLFDIASIIGGCIAIIGNTGAYLVGRFIMGFSVGAFSTVVPVYIQEYVPKHMVGKFGMLNFLNFSIGVVVAIVLGLPLEERGLEVSAEDSWWRLMTIFPCGLCFIRFFVLLFVYKIDSPFYCYIYKKNSNETINAFKYIYNNQEDINYVMSELHKEREHLEAKNNLEGVSYSELFSRKYIIRLVIGIILNIGQQTSAINIFTFYSNTIYLVNEPNVNATLFSSFLSFSELLGNFLAIFVIEKMGRKLNFLIGYGGVFLCMLLMTILYYSETASSAHKYIVIVYYFFAGASTDPIVWILTADLLPEIGVGICAAFNWLTVIIVVLSFPYMLPVARFGLNNIFLFYTVLTFVYLVFNFFALKETKNKSNLEIEKLYSKWF